MWPGPIGDAGSAIGRGSVTIGIASGLHMPVLAQSILLNYGSSTNERGSAQKQNVG